MCISVALPGSVSSMPRPSSRASCWRKTGPCPHGPVLQTVRPRKSAVTGASTLAGQQRAIAPAGHIADLGTVAVRGDGLRDEALVEGVPSGLDLARTVPPGALGLGKDSLVDDGQRAVGEQAARRWHATGQIDLGRPRPVVAECVG